jgi:hypothetical protein
MCEPKNDVYLTARGGTTKFYSIFCQGCRQWVLYYQKDGPGPLLRIYLDRIHSPANLSELQNEYSVTTVEDVPELKCSTCMQVLGTPVIYEPENRLAFQMIPQTFSYQPTP